MYTVLLKINFLDFQTIRLSQDKVKHTNTYGFWIELIQIVPQSSVIGPLIFDIYMNEPFLTLKVLIFVILKVVLLHLHIMIDLRRY